MTRFAINSFLVVALLTGVVTCTKRITKSKLETEWKDPSKHTVQFVTVDSNVQLEVLDWGGAGQPVVLLTGYGNSAHVFDEFAERLSETNRVYCKPLHFYIQRGGRALRNAVVHDASSLKPTESHHQQCSASVIQFRPSRCFQNDV